MHKLPSDRTGNPEEFDVVVEAYVLLRQAGDFSQRVPNVEKRGAGLGVRALFRHCGDVEEIQEGLPIARAVILVLVYRILELFLRQLH